MVNNKPIYRKQPFMGLLGDIVHVIAIFVSWYAIDALGYTPLQNIYIQLFAVWTLFMWFTAGWWPISKLKQPLKGMIITIAVFIGGFAHYHILSALGVPDEQMFPWIGGLFLATVKRCC
jgi:O-antigen/teichoic acid export membrane protein